MGGIGFQDETHRLSLEHDATKEKIKENQEKIKLNKQLPYLVGNVVEVCIDYFYRFSETSVAVFREAMCSLRTFCGSNNAN